MLKSVDASAAVTSAASAIMSWALNDLTPIILGVDLSTVLIGFSGVMLAVSLVPKDETPWWKAMIGVSGYVIGAALLPRLAIDLLSNHLHQQDWKALTFVLGLLLPVSVYFVRTNRVRIEDALFSWIRRRDR